MVKISDFNSLWEIAFAVNAIFVYFELTKALEEKFKGINSIGRDIINKVAEEKDKHYINSYGWRSVGFGYVIWVSRLKTISMFNSFAAICLIIISGFNPELIINTPFAVIIFIALFTPIIVIPTIIVYLLPIYKLKCIQEAIENIINRSNCQSEELTNLKRRYLIAIEYIKIHEFPFALFVKRNVKFSEKEIFEELKE